MLSVAPHIHREDVENTVVKVGQPVKFVVHIDGEPPPSVTWTCNGKPVESGVAIENADYVSKFAIVKSIRYLVI